MEEVLEGENVLLAEDEADEEADEEGDEEAKNKLGSSITAS